MGILDVILVKKNGNLEIVGLIAIKIARHVREKYAHINWNSEN